MEPDDEVVSRPVRLDEQCASMNAYYEMARRVKAIVFTALVFGLAWLGRWLWQFL